ncbi:MAG TPA: ABC transporter permease, partial [Vicinamibacterales bacterium]|nr:ABC transporter permease [Vicinamibacterales bacterium]
MSGSSSSSRVFGWLLRAFPRSFREIYGAEMSEDFARRLDAAGSLGRHRRMAVWIRSSVNVLAAGLAERQRSSFAVQLPGAWAPSKRGSIMFGWTQDLRFAARRLLREPGYAAFVTLTLALGIGANVAVFSVVDGVLLRSLPFHEADRLVGVWGRFLPESGFDFPQFSLSNPEYFDYRIENRTMADVGAWTSGTGTIGGPGENPERIDAAVATPSFFSVLRAKPLLGRLINETDPPPGPSSVVLLSHVLWQNRFGGRQDIVGQRVLINGTSREIIGVMPEDFDFPAGARIWVPLVITSSVLQQRQSHSTRAIAR